MAIFTHLGYFFINMAVSAYIACYTQFNGSFTANQLFSYELCYVLKILIRSVFS